MKRFVCLAALLMLLIMLVACESTNENYMTYSAEGSVVEATQTPESTTPQGPFAAVGAGYTSSFGLGEDGRLWAWGGGSGIARRESLPVLFMENVSQIASGRYHNLVIDKDGGLWAFGNNAYGQLGDGTTTFRTEPVHIMDNIVAAAAGTAGMGHSAAIDTEGRLWTWGSGSNTWGRLGDGTNDDSHLPIHVMDDIVAVALGSVHTVALDADGVMWTWGGNFRGQLGDDAGEGRSAPVAIKDNVRFVQAGQQTTYAITNDDVLWGWGHNFAGQLGDGTTEDHFFPIQIMEDVAYVSAFSSSTTMIITLDGGLWTFGNNDHGQLGIGEVEPNWSRGTYPQRVLDGMVSGAVGVGHSLGLDVHGNIWSWGRNDSGQLGDGTRVERHLPKRMAY
ncbi:MAG: hypothetical protein FWC76_02325 [Defluviitaleaceae bacterium]|nr:hypothetical protein [Defluviitaleaceae bacterium]